LYGTAPAGKHDLVSGLGATPIDYKAEDFVEQVRALTGDGMDAVFDPIGGAHLARSSGMLRRGGRLVRYGLSLGLTNGGSAWKGLAATTFSNIALWNTLPNGERATFYTIYTLKKEP
jgi:NADPH:quinone reductase